MKLMTIFYRNAYNEGTIEDMRQGAELALKEMEKRRVKRGGRHGMLDAGDLAVALAEVKEES